MSKYENRGLHPEHIRQLERADEIAELDAQEHENKVSDIRQASTLDELKRALLRYLDESEW